MTIVDKAAAKAEPVVTTLYIRSRAQNEKQKQTIPAHRTSITSERGRRADVRTTHALRPHVEEFAILEGQIFRCRIRCLNSVSIWSIAFASLCMNCCNWPALCASNVPAYATDQSLQTNSSSIFVLHCFSMFCCRLDITHGSRSFTASGRKFAARCNKFTGQQKSNHKTGSAVQTYMCNTAYANRIALLVFKSCTFSKQTNLPLKASGNLCMPIHVWSVLSFIELSKNACTFCTTNFAHV